MVKQNTSRLVNLGITIIKKKEEKKLNNIIKSFIDI